MIDEDTQGVLWCFTAPELLLHAALVAALAGSFYGYVPALAAVDATLRVVLLGVLSVSLVLPLWVWYDVRATGNDAVWVHVTAMPIVNLFGLLAYLDRRRRHGGSEAV